MTDFMEGWKVTPRIDIDLVVEPEMQRLLAAQAKLPFDDAPMMAIREAIQRAVDTTANHARRIIKKRLEKAEPELCPDKDIVRELAQKHNSDFTEWVNAEVSINVIIDEYLRLYDAKKSAERETEKDRSETKD